MFCNKLIHYLLCIHIREATNLCINKTSNNADVYSHEVDRAVLVIAANDGESLNIEEMSIHLCDQTSNTAFVNTKKLVV